MQLDEDRWIATLAAGSDRAVSTRVHAEIAEAYGSLARKAVWMVDHLRRRGVSLAPVAAEEHIVAWHGFVASAAAALRGDGNRAEIGRHPTVYLSYHHSSYPLLARSVLEAGVHVLVARDVPWLQAIGGRLINFMERPGDVLRACQRGDSVFAMMDYCYEKTRSARYISFLSYPARTPTGILSLARRYGLGVTLLTHDGKVDGQVERDVVRGMTVDELALWINRRIEERVTSEPAQWLMWASLDRRFQHVDYDS